MSFPHYSSSNPVSERNGYYFYFTDEGVESPERWSYLPEVTEQQMVEVILNPNATGTLSPQLSSLLFWPKSERRSSAWPAEGGMASEVSPASHKVLAAGNSQLSLGHDLNYLASVPGPGGVGAHGEVWGTCVKCTTSRHFVIPHMGSEVGEGEALLAGLNPVASAPVEGCLVMPIRITSTQAATKTHSPLTKSLCETCSVSYESHSHTWLLST